MNGPSGPRLGCRVLADVLMPRGWLPIVIGLARSARATGLATIFGVSVVAVPSRVALAQPPAGATRASSLSVPYPEGAHGDAEVVLDLDIAKDGSVSGARLRRGRNPFARAARLAALGWRFPPSRRSTSGNSGALTIRVLFKDPQPIIPALGPLASQLEDPALSPEAVDAEFTDAEAPAEEVVVQAERRSEIGGTYIPREEGRQIPGTFADPFRVIEVLPGVAPIVSGLPYFYVRGAPPGNVGYFIDGIRVPLLFHVGAGPSVMAPGLIDRVDVVPSAYSARYGRAAGGVILGETTASSGVARGEFQARAFDASGLLEVPLGDMGSSLLVGGRYSYVQPLLDRIAPDYELGYWDYQARATFQVGARDVLSVFAFGASDELENRPLQRQLLDTQFHRLDLRWDHSGSSSTTRVALTGSIDRAANAEDDPVVYGSEIESRGVRLRLASDLALSRNVTLRSGGDAGFERISRELVRVEDRTEAFPTRIDVSGSAYLDAVFTGPHVEVVPGVRVDAARFRNEPYVFVEPRLGSRLVLFDGFAWVSQFGIAHQFPTQSVRIPGQASDPLESTVQAAWQAAQGVEFGKSSILIGKIMAFHSWIDTDEDALTGRSYGIETFLRREFGSGIGGILSYTLSRTETTVGNDTQPSEFDRTHVVSAVLGWNMGAGFRLGLRGYYALGRRYAVPCPTLDCGPADPTAPLAVVRRGRLPNFYRADVRLEKRWELGDTGWLGVALEWFNATRNEETTFVAWNPATGLTYGDRDALTLPSIGIEGGF